MEDMFKINLQLFADGDIEETADLTTEGEEVDTNVENDGDQQPDIDTTPEEQSTNKDNPANHAFAEMRRKMKEQDLKLQTMTKKQQETDNYYANLAKSKGRTDIATADEYFKAVRAEELSAEYQETQDPMKLAVLIKEMIMPEIKQTRQEPTQDIESMFDNELTDFNKEFKGNLKSIDDILTLPNNEKVIGYMQNNNLSLSEAYKLANPDKIAAATKQAVINQTRGHAHVGANSNGGKIDTTVVTAGEIADWKRWFPSKTDEQCRKEISANKKILSE